jgi:hypothetical protein
MDDGTFFKQCLDHLRIEGRYRVFANLERRCGLLPPGRLATNDGGT